MDDDTEEEKEPQVDPLEEEKQHVEDELNNYKDEPMLLDDQ